ncbi:MAG: glycerophosphodiester phosphodiesterase [Arthrobacter sp.]
MGKSNRRRRQEFPAGLAFRSLLPGLLRAGRDLLKLGGWRLLAVYAATQALPLLLVSPLLHWMFTQALASTGAVAVNSAGIAAMLVNRVSLAWLAGLSVLALLTVSLQLAVLVVAAAQVRAGGTLRPAVLLRICRPLIRRLLRPGSLSLGAYLFLAVPLTQAGFFSALTHSISIPNFVSGEMLKSTQGTLIYVSFLVVVGTIALRYSLAVPLFAMGGINGAKAMRLSWRMTGRTTPALLAGGAVAVVVGMLSGAVLVMLALLPTLAADLLLPRAAAAVAAFSLGAAQVAGVVIAGGFVLFVAGMLLELTERSIPLLDSAEQARWSVSSAAPGATERPISAGAEGAGQDGHIRRTSLNRRRRNAARAAVAGAAVVPAMILGIVNLPVMEGLRNVPEALVLGHRGFSGGGVENTISGLRAASAVGADLVEMDVMQSSDGEFVVMHDASLQRLAGRNEAVGDLTLAELTSLTVHDQFGHSDSIPSLRDYILAAQEAGEPLLIELKLHGGETEDYVERLIAELESLDALHENIYHSLSQEKAEELKRLRPELYVGLTLAVAGVAAPATTADFIVVEEASYTAAVRESAWADGKDVYVWTVNGSGAIRNMLRDGVDGIITDHPDLALQDRAAMGPDEPMSSKLYDALMRFVVIF